MEQKYFKTWSKNLNREMEYKIYGNAGRSVLVFPSQDQRFFEWEDNGMIEVLQPMIDYGEIRLICCDSIDVETWSLSEGDQHERISLHERWYNYIISELIPQVRRGNETFIATGCSMGGYHSGNIFFRRPDLFDTLLSLSGLFHADYFFPHYNDELIYRNSPIDFLQNISADSDLVRQYREKRIICCCGQGEYEGITSASTLRLGHILQNLNVDGWFDLWGSDVSHDFFWWRKQASYFFNDIIHGQLALAA